VNLKKDAARSSKMSEIIHTRVRWHNSEDRNLIQDKKYAHLCVHINSTDVIKLWKKFTFIELFKKSLEISFGAKL
jgi:hypothetical protein